eukprot:jgi/Psemu1/12456/gm1.12456_g
MSSQSHRYFISLSWGTLRNAVGMGIILTGLSSLIIVTTAQRAGNTVSITRSIEPTVDDLLDGSDCDFAGKIVLGGFNSLESNDNFFSIGTSQLTAFNLMMDQINRYECGIHLNGLGNFSLELRIYDDQSSTTESSKIGNKLATDSSVDIMVAGYSSTVTLPYVEIARNQSDKLVLAPAAASTNVFLDKPLAFGMVPPTSKYMEKAVEALATINACAAVPGLAEQFGMIMTSTTEVVNAPNFTVLEPVAETLKGEDPDVVIACVYDCAPWVQAMRKVNWSPNAQVFTVCIGQAFFPHKIGTDIAYIMGVTPWDSSLQIEDAVTGWTPKDFASSFRRALNGEETSDVPYQAAMSEYISSNTFQTMGGKYSFDENGQSKAPSLMVQYDANGEVQTVYPLETSSGPILYPMPTWDRRDCIKLSMCEGNEGNVTSDSFNTGNSCDDTGTCISGATANCIQQEEMNYINHSLKVLSWIGCGFLLIFCSFALGWIYYYRENSLVRNIPSDFSESSCIFLSVMFMFQILVLAGTVSAMVHDDMNVFFFIRAAAVFFQNFTVLALIFLPKMQRIYMGEDTALTVKNAMLSSMRFSPAELKDTTYGYQRRRTIMPVYAYREESDNLSAQVPQSSISARADSQSDGIEDGPLKSSAMKELERNK